jgi:CheY-like chemotaxis protein
MAERTRVLIVDDEQMMRELVSAMLPPEEYAVEAVDGGPNALAAISARRPDLVLLDLNMPGMTGWQVIDRLKDLPSPPPVIAMSGMGTSEPPELHGVRQFVLGYLPKPFSHEQLLTTSVRSVPCRHRRWPAGRPSPRIGGTRGEPCSWPPLSSLLRESPPP